ncbi:MAG: adenylate kinase [Bradyrhizobium sp.]
MRAQPTTGTKRISGEDRRIVVIGNSGGGKSTLARRLGAACGLPHTEIDALLWEPGWSLTPAEVYAAEHARLIAADKWIIDGLGRRDSIPARLSRASCIVLVDLPLWMHFWLAAERQLKWSRGAIENPPAGLAKMPPTEAIFRTIWEVDREWMPEIRQLATLEERQGKTVFRLTSIDDLDRFELSP